VAPCHNPITYALRVSTSRTVSMVTLGCARNEVDSEELAARLAAGGWTLRGEGEEADVVLVNTCGFIQAAKQESIDELLAAADSGAKVAAVGCLAERYGSDLAEELPEAQVLSFDDYTDIAARLDDVLAGRRRPAHVARDRRTLLPVSPAQRQVARETTAVPGTGQEAIPDLPGGGWLTGRPPRSRSRRAATGAARSARSRPSAAHSCRAGHRNCWPRHSGWPPRTCASWSS
jgi:hypothetical protein